MEQVVASWFTNFRRKKVVAAWFARAEVQCVRLNKIFIGT